MKVEFVREKKLDALLETEFPEYADDSPQARQWDAIAEGLGKVLSRFAGDMGSPDATGEPGFLSSDIFQGYECLDAEFNTNRLVEPDALKAIADFLDAAAPHYSFAFSFFSEDKDGMLTAMHSGVYRNGTLYLPSTKTAKLTLRNAGWSV